jgi:Fur family ferric uptake transcriptional regulator
MATNGKVARVHKARAEDHFRLILRSVGLKCTNARLSTLMQLSRADRPLTHGELTAMVVTRGFDPATIFRNLIEFVSKGIAVRIDAGDHVWRFELRNSGSPDDTHPHFLCVGCGEVHCLPGLHIPSSAFRAGKLEAIVSDVQDVLVRGLCQKCG